MYTLLFLTSGGEISKDGLQALGFLIFGTADKKSLASLTSLALLPSELPHSGYSEVCVCVCYGMGMCLCSPQTGSRYLVWSTGSEPDWS